MYERKSYTLPHLCVILITIWYGQVKYREGDLRQETFRMFSGNKKPALERGAVELFLLCGNGRICIGRKYPQVHRTSEQSVLILWRRGNVAVKENIHKGQPEYANLIGHMCYAASKLWNVCNYERQHYKETGIEQYPDWYYQKKAHKEDLWYKQLPSQTAQEVCKLLDKAWKSFLCPEKIRGDRDSQTAAV